LSRQILRAKAAAARVGVGLTKFREDYTDTGGDPHVPGTNEQVERVRPVALGERAVGFFDDEIDRLQDQLRAWRDAKPRTPPTPAVHPEFHPSRHRRSAAADP
jgi:hypothetical protein